MVAVTTWIVGTGPIGLEAEGERGRSRLASVLGAALREAGLGSRVEVRAALTYSELLGWVGRREVQLAWLGPALFVHAESRFGVTALVRAVRDGRQSYRGALFAREGSALRGPDDLRGTRVAWVDPDSCAGFLFPRIALAQRGLDPDATFSELRILGSHGAVVRAVASGQADVGATFVELRTPDDASSAVVRAGWSGSPVPMRPVLITDPVPADVVVATRVVSPDARERVASTLAGLGARPDGAAVLRELFQASALEPVDAAEYVPVRSALRAVGVRV